MKRFLVFLFLMIPLVLWADEGVGILFDNSGSMAQHFSSDMLRDAKNTISDLILEGKYDQNIWQIEAQSKSYQTNVWKPGQLVYVHAFGELTSRVEPFFKEEPEWGEINSKDEARQFIRDKLFSKLKYNDQFTNFDLAKNLCWYKLATELGSIGKQYYLNLILVSDFLRDPQRGYAGAGDRIQNLFINNNAAETTYFRLVHNKTASQNVRLEIRLLRIGPLFISQPPPTPPVLLGPGSDLIVLSKPRNPLVLSAGDNKGIKFEWVTNGNFEKFIFEIQSVKPKRKVLSRVLKTGKSTTIPSRTLLQKMDRLKSDQLVWFVKGIYPEDHSSGSLSSSSNRFNIKREKTACGSGLWIILLIIALIAGLLYTFPKIKEKLKNRDRNEPSKRTLRPPADDDDDW